MCEVHREPSGVQVSEFGYCWICKAEVPLLTKPQVRALTEACGRAADEVKAYRDDHGVDFAEVPQAEIFAPVHARHRALTGVDLSHVTTSAHHILVHQKSCFGPPCDSCGKLLRTWYDRVCFECGAVREEDEK